MKSATSSSSAPSAPAARPRKGRSSSSRRGRPAGKPAKAMAAPPAPGLRRVRFGCFKPDAAAVSVVGSFNAWDARTHAMVRDEFGSWETEIDLPPGEHHYRFIVDGEWADDPTAVQTAPNGFGGFDAVMLVV